MYPVRSNIALKYSVENDNVITFVCLLNSDVLFSTNLQTVLTSSVERFFSKILQACLNDVYALSPSLLLLKHSLLKL